MLRTILICRLSLAFMWLLTAATSIWWGRSIGYDVLATVDIYEGQADFCINTGAALDAIIGFWLLSGRHQGLCYKIQLAVILTYSLLLTIIAPQFWLHPFGPLVKNFPIIMLVYLLLKFHQKQ
jgi:hypothetical protein